MRKRFTEATGDQVFKGFLPFTWNTDYVVQMRDAMQKLKNDGKPVTVFNMQISVPSVSALAHDYFIRNAEDIHGILPDATDPKAGKPFDEVLLVAGLVAAAIVATQIIPLIPLKRYH